MACITGQQPAPPSPPSLDPRPQMNVLGFEGLTCCTDWPQLKKGEPPNAQSAIFNPLIACALGSIEDHCTAEQLQFAQQWWAAALPAWPRWVAQLRDAGVATWRQELIAQAKVLLLNPCASPNRTSIVFW